MKIDNDTIRSIHAGLILTLTTLLFACGHPNAEKSLIDMLYNAPVTQTPLSSTSFAHKGYTLTPKADYYITARVLATEKYYLDAQSDIMPIDVALAWGELAKDEYIEQMSVSQRRRWYYWHTDTLFMPMKEISASSSNHHLIASNDDIASKIAGLDPNDIVVLKGMLVDVDMPNGSYIKTSLSRNDTGAGACEVLFVDHIEIFSKK